MARALPCTPQSVANKAATKFCGTATITDGAGKKIPYSVGVQPSAFKTPGFDFVYRCLGCGNQHRISKKEFYSLPDA